MKLKISQRPEVFFDLFIDAARNLRETAELLKDLIEDYRDVDLKVRRIEDREHEGDEWPEPSFSSSGAASPDDEDAAGTAASRILQTGRAVATSAGRFACYLGFTRLPQLCLSDWAGTGYPSFEEHICEEPANENELEKLFIIDWRNDPARDVAGIGAKR